MEVEEILQHLDCILQDSLFRSSKRSISFLNYICRKTLEGNQDQIKEYSIGIDAFGLDPAFDPQQDPRVRVEAMRLRQRLEEYYEKQGKEEPFRIIIPKGSYIPEFHNRQTEDASGETETFKVGHTNITVSLPRLKERTPFTIESFTLGTIKNNLFLYLSRKEGEPTPKVRIAVTFHRDPKGVFTVVIRKGMIKKVIPLISSDSRQIREFQKKLNKTLNELTGNETPERRKGCV